MEKRWYFSVEDWNGDVFYLDFDGNEIDGDAARETPWDGNQDEAMKEADRRVDLWQERTGADVARVAACSIRWI